MRALWDNIRFNKPKNKYSLEHLKYLYSVISKNPIINEQNKVIIIETLRQIAELLIWGDQHNSVFFDYFLEKNLLAYFLNILDQKTSKNVKVQLLQTLSILIENIRAQNSLYYLFSNNHVNELIIHRFDFSDEEVLAYYISLLKTLSLKLDRSTIQFFFNAQENDFPLYTEAIKFFNHEEGMIRIAVRTLTLNVYRVEDEAMRKYILNSTAVPYFSNIVWFIRQQCHTLDQMVHTTSHDNRRKLDDFVAEMLDHFYYLHDIFCLGIESMSLVLSEQLLHYLLTPLLVESLGAATTTPKEDKEDKEDKEGQNEDEKKISPVLALFLLAQVFTVFTHKPLINTLAAALIHPDPSTFSALKQQCPVGPPPPLSDLAPKRTHYVSFRRFSSVPNLEVLEANSMKGTQSAPPSPVPPATHDSNAVAIKSPRQSEPHPDSKFISPSPSKSSPSLLSLDEPSQDSSGGDFMHDGAGIPTIQIEDYSQQQESPMKSNSVPMPSPEEASEKGRNKNRDALLGFFDDDRTALNALCMLVALVKNEAVDRDLLEVGGLFPYRLTKAKYLLDILTNSTGKPPALAVSHLKEEQQHHSRSKSDSHAVAMAITDLNLRRKALVNNLVPDLVSAHALSVESDGSENAANTSMAEDNDTAGATDAYSAIRPHRALSQVKKPLPPTPLGRVDDLSKQPSSHQHAFTHALIGGLLNLLVKSNRYRLVTLQMTLALLKELVCSPDSPPGLTSRQLATFEKAYRGVSDIFERRLSVEIFLELFDVEVKNYKPPNFEFLIKDAALLLPVSGTSKSRLDLPRRLPSSETEITQQAIQQYLVLRELKYTILHKKDDVLPHLKQHIPTINVSPKDQYTIDSTAECMVIPFVIVVQGASVLKKRQKRLLVVNKESLVVLDPANSAPKPQGTQPEETKPVQPGHNAVSGTVVHAAPLQSISLEIDRNDPLSLHVTSHPTTWSMPMVFEDEKKCETAYEILMVARNELRDTRIHKIRTLLATSESKPYESTTTDSPIGSHDDPTDAEDGIGIDSIIHTVEKINKSSKVSSPIKHRQPTTVFGDNLTSTGFTSDIETTDLTEQTEPTERIDLTEEYSDPELQNAADSDLIPSNPEFSPEPIHSYETPFIPSDVSPQPATDVTEPTLTEPAPETDPGSEQLTPLPSEPISQPTSSDPTSPPSSSAQIPSNSDTTPSESTSNPLVEPTTNFETNTLTELTQTVPLMPSPTSIPEDIPSKPNPELNPEPDITPNAEPSTEPSTEPNTEPSTEPSTEPDPTISSPPPSNHSEHTHTSPNGKQIDTTNGYSDNVHSESYSQQSTPKLFPSSDPISNPYVTDNNIDPPFKHPPSHPLTGSDDFNLDSTDSIDLDDTPLSDVPLTPPTPSSVPNGTTPH